MTFETNFFSRRRAGVLLHISSLPGPQDHGDFGAQARRFVDFLADCGIAVWQMLPLGPPHGNGSPYSALSAHAGHSHYISLSGLVERGWLTEAPADAHCDSPVRSEALKKAGGAFSCSASTEDRKAFDAFRENNENWLPNYAVFSVLRDQQQQQPWWQWPDDQRRFSNELVDHVFSEHATAVEQVCFEQFVFFQQWADLKAYAHQRGILLFGDMPIFVDHDSADVWSEPQYFALDDDGRARFVAGVPPDYFSETGQRWGNPQYDWEALERSGFEWWQRRIRSQFQLFDWIRIDHFRAFESYWRIPAEAETAVEGEWIKAPGDALLTTLQSSCDGLNLVAEDLGIITEEVEALRDRFHLPGMKILQFAFDGSPDNPYLPENHVESCIVYSGTHDNNTTLGWIESLDVDQRARVCDALGCAEQDLLDAVINAALQSPALAAILPMQDLLRLDGAARMNVPGTVDGNWQWRFDWSQVDGAPISRFCSAVSASGRGTLRNSTQSQRPRCDEEQTTEDAQAVFD